jgi:hypothetical protein
VVVVNYFFGEEEKKCNDTYGFNNYFEGYYRSRDGRINGKVIYLPKDFTAQRFNWKSESVSTIYPNLFVDAVISICGIDDDEDDVADIFQVVYRDVKNFKPYKDLINTYYRERAVGWVDMRCGLFLRFDRVEFAFPFEMFELKILNKGEVVITRRDLDVIMYEMRAGLWPTGRSGIDERFSRLFTDVGNMPKYDD